MAQHFVNLENEKGERYAMSKFFAYTDNFDPLTSYFASEIAKLPVSGYYTIQGEDERPDLAAYRIYGDTQYWWVLLMYNKILEFNGIATGETLPYPSLTDIEDLYFSLKAKETAKSQE